MTVISFRRPSSSSAVGEEKHSSSSPTWGMRVFQPPGNSSARTTLSIASSGADGTTGTLKVRDWSPNGGMLPSPFIKRFTNARQELARSSTWRAAGSRHAHSGAPCGEATGLVMRRYGQPTPTGSLRPAPRRSNRPAGLMAVAGGRATHPHLCVRPQWQQGPPAPLDGIGSYGWSGRSQSGRKEHVSLNVRTRD